jgi:hypothetical protein
MKKIILLGLFFYLLVPALTAQTVYITKSGSKYHIATCSYLSKSSIPMELSELSSKYSACSRCNPTAKKTETKEDVKTQKNSSSVTESKLTKSTKPAVSGRCQATTKKGSQCKRNAAAGSSYCWQHK